LIDPLTGLPYTSSTTDPIPVTLTEGTIGEVSQGPAGSAAWLVSPFGQYNSPSPTLTPGQAIVIQLDQNGNLQVNLASKIAGELQTYNVMNSHPASVEVALHTATTIGVQDYTGACICAGIEIQTPVASTVIKIYDSVGSAANLKGQVTLPASLLNDGPLPPFCVGMEFVNGIWFVMSTGASVVAVKVAAAS
jgi:hypothetical protein